MTNNKWEKFEQEYTQEINKLRNLRFETVPTPAFSIPTYKFMYTKALSLAFAIPALVVAFGFAFMYSEQTSIQNKDLAQIEASNTRILNQINQLDYENNI